MLICCAYLLCLFVFVSCARLPRPRLPTVGLTTTTTKTTKSSPAVVVPSAVVASSVLGAPVVPAAAGGDKVPIEAVRWGDTMTVSTLPPPPRRRRPLLPVAVLTLWVRAGYNTHAHITPLSLCLSIPTFPTLPLHLFYFPRQQHGWR